MERLRALAWLSKVIELESFSGAARALRVSKAAVSQGIAQLEKDLGARLLHRTTRKVSATAAGRAVQARARLLLEGMQELEAVARAERAEPVGTLRVTAPVSFAHVQLGGIVAGFVRAHPAVQLELSLTDRFVRIAEEGYDLAVRVAAEPDDDDVHAIRLGTVRLAVCASPAYLARAGRPRAPRDLPAHACLAYAAPGASARVAWRFEARGRDEIVEVDPVVRSDSSALLGQLARAGAGLALLPSFVYEPDVRAGGLVEIFRASRGLTVFALVPAPRQMTAKVKAFVRFLREGLAPGDAGAADAPPPAR